MVASVPEITGARVPMVTGEDGATRLSNTESVKSVWMVENVENEDADVRRVTVEPDARKGTYKQTFYCSSCHGGVLFRNLV